MVSVDRYPGPQACQGVSRGETAADIPTHCFSLLAILAELTLVAWKPFFLCMETR